MWLRAYIGSNFNYQVDCVSQKTMTISRNFSQKRFLIVFLILCAECLCKPPQALAQEYHHTTATFTQSQDQHKDDSVNSQASLRAEPPGFKTQPAQKQDAAYLSRPINLLTFYSHSLGENFPHAFVILKETSPNSSRSETYPQSDVDTLPNEQAFGFSARRLGPGLLLGSVKGHIVTPKRSYIDKSDAHFTISLSAEQTAAIQRERGLWDEAPGNRYNLNKHNCVHFVSEIAQIAGLDINPDSDYYKKPKSFLEEVTHLNADRLAIDKRVIEGLSKPTSYKSGITPETEPTLITPTAERPFAIQ